MQQTPRQQMIYRIKERDVAQGRELAEVAGAADFEAVLKSKTSPPSVHIVRVSSRRTDNGHTLTIVDSFAFFISVRNVRDARGDDSSDAAESWSKKIALWLKGWQPTLEAGDQFESLKLAQGSQYRWTDQVLIWNDIYQLTYARRCCS